MARWAPINLTLLQHLKSGTTHSKVDAALVLASDRLNGVERSAREYAKIWAWSPDKARRFLNDPESVINLAQVTNETGKASNDAGLPGDTSQQRDNMSTKVNKSETSQQRVSNETGKASIDAGLLAGTSQIQVSNESATSHVFIKETNRLSLVQFEAFYSSYPKRKNRAAAEKAFRKLAPSPELLGQMMDALNWQAQQPEWLKNNGQYIPLPASWLNGRRWEDERPATMAAPPATSTADTGASADYLRQAGLIA